MYRQARGNSQIDALNRARTRLSTLHPYPAMVADELAQELCSEHVIKDAKVLDPFCGSGRLLVAAETARLRVGVDANPLAWLLTTAKLSAPNPAIVDELLADLRRVASRPARHVNRIDSLTHHHAPAGRRFVEWFSPEAAMALERIVRWVNKAELAEPELLLVAVALSGTVRSVSFARQKGWKLHRRPAAERVALNISAWKQLEERLVYCRDELRRTQAAGGVNLVAIGDARRLHQEGSVVARNGPYDLVLTSPPYGDSRTTVQYGAASALCLSVIGRLKGLERLARNGSAIDSDCLGGTGFRDGGIDYPHDFKRFWAGGRDNRFAGAVRRFVGDYAQVCGSVARCVKPGGKAVFVVGRRSTGGFRLKLDEFTVEQFENVGFELISREARTIKQKRLPRRINRYGRLGSTRARNGGIVPTMTEEIIVVLRKLPAIETSAKWNDRSIHG